MYKQNYNLITSKITQVLNDREYLSSCIAFLPLHNTQKTEKYLLKLWYSFYCLTFYCVTFYCVTFYCITFYCITFYGICVTTKHKKEEKCSYLTHFTKIAFVDSLIIIKWLRVKPVSSIIPIQNENRQEAAIGNQ